MMPKIVFLGLLIAAVSAVAVADIFLKKAALGGGLAAAFKSPWVIGAVFLYLFQVFFFLYLFVAGSKLSIVSILQTGLYALITLVAGVFLFNESLRAIQVAGIILTLAGVLLLNF